MGRIIRGAAVQFDVIQYAKQARSIYKSIPIIELAKLDDLVVNTGGDALEVKLQFYMSDEGFPAVKGSVQGSLKLVCQRCTGTMLHELDVELALILVSPKQNISEMDVKLESYIYDSNEVELADLISDDIILGLPQIAKHLDENCAEDLLETFEQNTRNIYEDKKTSEPRDDLEKPFANLKQLLRS